MATPTATTPAPATPEEAEATMGDAEATRNQLAAFEAGALKSPNPNATRRFKLEFELDQMQATDEAFFDFWVECVHLAVANMQATRLQYLQLRVEKLENPDTPPLGAVLLSMAASLLEQLVVVGVIELAAGTAIAVGGWFAYQCAASRIASGLKVAQIAAADAAADRFSAESYHRFTASRLGNWSSATQQGVGSSPSRSVLTRLRAR
jgi:hypothetical protein